MTQLLLPKSVNTMAHSTSFSTTSAPYVSEVIELPRYRRNKSKALESDTKLSTITNVQRYDSFDSSYSHSVPESTDLQQTDTKASTTSLLSKPIVRKLVFRRHWFHTDMTICSVDLSAQASPSPIEFSNNLPASPPEAETPMYHLQTSEFSFKNPDIIMYSGSKQDPAQVLAISSFRWSRNARMAFGSDALDDKSPNVSWEEMRNTSNYCLHSTYEFSVPANTPTSTASGPTSQRFRLQRTHSPQDGVTGFAGRWSYRNYLLISLDTHEPTGEGETVGVFLADNLRSLTKKGELRLFKHLSKEVEVGVVLALGSVSEKHTRRERKSRHHGGGG